MDNSWLFDNEVDNHEPESDEEETQRELESRLYAIVHHNDLSQPLAPSLAKHFSVVGADDGELEVTLKHSLDDIKLEDIDGSCTLNRNENTLENNDSNQVNNLSLNDKGTAAEVLPLSGVGISNNGIDIDKRHLLKRVRYSDINLDSSATEKDVNLQPQPVNFFNFGPGLFRGKNSQFSKLIVPKSFNPLDWKNEANSSFISIQESKDQKTILDQMTQALVRCNPGVKIPKLAKFAAVLYQRNLKASRRKRNKKLKSTNSSVSQNYSLNDNANTSNNLAQELNLLKKNLDSDIQKCKSKMSKKQRKNATGSISLNISPFRPEPLVVDLVSDDDNVVIEDNTTYTSTPKFKSIKRNQLQLPSKWTREMAKFYIKTNPRKLKMDANRIINYLKGSTTAKDWMVDPRDETGFYQRSASSRKKPKRRCANCKERGHGVQECPRPLKSCILCGQSSHLSYSCPYKICCKCGLFISKGYEGNECYDCYYINLNYDNVCEICGAVFHKTVNCTDLWRSFHATTGGEKKVPAEIIKNRRRFCCNCGNEKHFSEDCPFPQYSGQQTSSFVSNYSCDIEELGTSEIIFPHNYSHILTCPQADEFLQELSTKLKAGIFYNENENGLVFQIKGTFEQCKKVKTEIQTFVNVNKRKWQGPTQSSKRQRVF